MNIHQGTRHSVKDTPDSLLPLYAIDFGTGDALAIYGPFGPVSKRDLRLPRVKGGKTPAMEFIMIAEALLQGSDTLPSGGLVFESPTVGASGCETADLQALVARHPGKPVYTVSARAVKNYRKDHGLQWAKGGRYARDGAPPPQTLTLEAQTAVHAEDAELIYRIATEQPERLHLWAGAPEKVERLYTSVRPMDKRLYRDARSDAFMAKLPPFESLPLELQAVLGVKGDYSRAMAMPFAMASDEPYLDEGPFDERRKRYERLIGLYDHGYPSFYRRAVTVWMQTVAKGLAGVTKMDEVPPPVRKQAWKITQRQIRALFHLAMKHQGR